MMIRDKVAAGAAGRADGKRHVEQARVVTTRAPLARCIPAMPRRLVTRDLFAGASRRAMCRRRHFHILGIAGHHNISGVTGVGRL